MDILSLLNMHMSNSTIHMPHGILTSLNYVLMCVEV